MPECLANPIELFYPGNHTDFRRKTVRVNQAELESAVSWFNANNVRLPLVVGHPDTEDAPLGVGTKLDLKGDRVVIVEVDDVDPTFKKIVNSGELSGVSAMIRLPGHPKNKSAGIEFQHAGFFGKSPVALDKLRSASFAAPHDKEFWFMSKKKMEDEDLEDEDLEDEDLEDEDLEEDGESESDEKEELEKQKKALTAKMAAFEEERAAFQRARAIEPDLEKWVREGRVLPAEKAGFVALFAAMPDDLELSFSATTGEVEQSGSEFLKDFLSNLKPRVPYGEMSAPERGEDKQVARFAAAGATVADDDMDLLDRVIATGVDVSDTAAFSRALQKAMEAN